MSSSASRVNSCVALSIATREMGRSRIEALHQQRDSKVDFIAYTHEKPSSEDPADPRNYWHIFDVDNGPGYTSVHIHIPGPDTPELHAAIIKISEAIDAALSISVSARR